MKQLMGITDIQKEYGLGRTTALRLVKESGLCGKVIKGRKILVHGPSFEEFLKGGMKSE